MAQQETKGVKENLYDEFREQGHTVSAALDLADKFYKEFIREWGETK